MLCIYIRFLCRTLIQTRSIIEEKMTQHFPKFYRDINTQIQKTLQMPSRINTKKKDQESQGGWGETLAPVVMVIRGWSWDEASHAGSDLYGSDLCGSDFPLAQTEDAPRFSELAQM